jgi:hypothetical protein
MSLHGKLHFNRIQLLSIGSAIALAGSSLTGYFVLTHGQNVLHQATGTAVRSALTHTPSAPRTRPSASTAALPTPSITASATPANSSATPSESGSNGSSGSGSSLACTNPAFQTAEQNGTWSFASNVLVNNNAWGPSGSSWSQQLNACSPANWYVTANFQPDGGAIQTYPDTEYTLSGKTVAQYNSMSTCFGEKSPASGEWDYAYDTWLNNFGIEVMVWNDWTDTGIYPPSGARAVTIDGVAYHEFKGGGSNEWIYTRDSVVASGCFSMLDIFRDLLAHPSTSGITSSSVPNAIEYGVEIASTNGPTAFQITNATLTAN